MSWAIQILTLPLTPHGQIDSRIANIFVQKIHNYPDFQQEKYEPTKGGGRKKMLSLSGKLSTPLGCGGRRESIFHYELQLTHIGYRGTPCLVNILNLRKRDSSYLNQPTFGSH